MLDVLAVQFKATVCVATATPVPDREIVAGEPLALLVTVIVPLLEPAAVGAYTTLKARLCPAVSVTGALAPLSVKVDPVSAMLEIVTLAFPVLVTVTVCVEDDPAFTFPKDRLFELNESVCDAATPVPLNGIEAGEFGALLTIDRAPVTPPVEAGEKTTLKVVDWLAASEIGNDSVLVPKPLPLTPTWLMVSVPVPLFTS